MFILLNYDYMKNHYRLIEVDVSRQKELNADPKAIQQIWIVGQLKNVDNDYNAIDGDETQTIFILKILEKIKKMIIKFS